MEVESSETSAKLKEEIDERIYSASKRQRSASRRSTSQAGPSSERSSTAASRTAQIKVEDEEGTIVISDDESIRRPSPFRKGALQSASQPATTPKVAVPPVRAVTPATAQQHPDLYEFFTSDPAFSLVGASIPKLIEIFLATGVETRAELLTVACVIDAHSLQDWLNDAESKGMKVLWRIQVKEAFGRLRAKFNSTPS